MPNEVGFKMFDDEEEQAVESTNIFMATTEHYTAYTTSRSIAEQFGMEHKNVLSAIRKIINDDKTGNAAKSFQESSYLNSQNKKQPEYLVNQNGFQLLCLSKMAISPDIRVKFNTMFNAYNEKNRNDLCKAAERIQELEARLQNGPAVPMTRDEIISQGLIAAHEVIEEQKQLIAQQTQQIAAAQADVDFANAFKGSDNNILVRTLAAKINGELTKEGYPNKVGQTTMFEWLKRHGFIISSKKSRDYNMPTKKAIEMGVLDSKYTTIQHKTVPGTWNSGTTEITPKGVEYFRRKIKDIYYNGGTIEND